jgi:hypothetical protein
VADKRHQGHPVEDTALALVESLDEDELWRFVGTVLEASPATMQRVSDELLGELKEEVLRDDTDFAYAVHHAIVEIENKWRGELR